MSLADQGTKRAFGSLNADQSVGGGEVSDGGPIKLISFMLTSTHATNTYDVTIEDNSGNRLWLLRMPPLSKFVWDVPVLLEDGLVFKSVGNGNIRMATVFAGDSAGVVVARRLVHAQLNAALTLESGDPVILHGFCLSNLGATTSGATFLQTAESSPTNLFKARLPTSTDAQMIDVKFVEDRGLQFPAADVTTVYVTAAYDRTG